MSRIASTSRLDLSAFPDVWRVEDLARVPATISCGAPALDVALPGGGWPTGALVEVLQRTPGRHVWQLVLPALSRTLQDQAGPIVLVAPPFRPFAPSLAAQGLQPERLLCLQADRRASRLWAAEQSLRCEQVAAVLAWLPEARSEELRRLHLAAQRHERLLFVFRGIAEARQASPAALRLVVDGVDPMEVRIIKRKGPPAMQPLHLPATSRRLAALLQARRSLRRGGPEPLPAAGEERSHGLDRTAAIP